MTRRRMFVHIGLHKTGTTSIQSTFSAGSQRLHQQGVLYPMSGRHPLAAAQHGLVAKAFDPSTPFIGDFALAGVIDRSLITAALRHEIDLSGLTTVALSSEEFSRFGRESLNLFGAEFADFDLYPVAFIRKHTSILEGYYATLLLYTSQYYELTTDYVRLDLVESFRRWAAISADSQIRIVDIDASPAGDSVHDMLGVLGLDPDLLSHLKRFGRLNRSPTPLVTAAIRELRRAGVGEHDIRELIEHLQPVRVDEPYTCIPPSLWDELETQYADQHAQLRSASWVTGLEDVSPPDGRGAPPYLDSMAAVVVAFSRLLDRNSA